MLNLLQVCTSGTVSLPVLLSVYHVISGRWLISMRNEGFANNNVKNVFQNLHINNTGNIP